MKTKQEALDTIRESYSVVKGKRYARYEADLGTLDGKRKIIRRNTKAELVRAVNEWFRHRRESGSSVERLQPWQLDDAVSAYSAMYNAGVTRRLTEIVYEWIENFGRQTPKVLVKDAYASYCSKFGDSQTATKKIVRSRVGAFAEKFGGENLDEVSAKSIVAYLDANYAGVTWNNHMTYIRTFYSWCMKKPNEWVSENPLDGVEKKVVAAKRPEYLPGGELAKLFAWAESWNDRRRDCALYVLVLSYFCGMRTAEIMRQKFSDIRMEDQFLRVTEAKGEQSGGRGRAFRIPDAAFAWLKTVDFAKAEEQHICDSTWNNWIGIIEGESGVDMPKNGGRKSFITHYTALAKTVDEVSRVVGNSEDVRKRHYDGMVSEREAREYFAVLPKAQKAPVDEHGRENA